MSSLHSTPLFSPMPLIDREETRTGSPMPLRSSYWNDDRPLDHHSSFSPYARRDSLGSPLVGVSALPTGPTRSGSAAMPYSHRGTGADSTSPHQPDIDLNALIPLEYTPSSPAMPSGKLSLGSAGLYGDDWSYGNSYHHRTLPPLNWTDSSSAPQPSHFAYNNGYSPSSPYASDGTSSGSGSPNYFLPANAPALPPPRRGSAHNNNNNNNPDGAPKKECFHCHVTTTPLWRREPQTQRPLCNACGLYLQQRNKLRPQELIDADRDDSDDEINRIPDSEYTGPKCSHCLTRQTSVWRRSKTGQQVCNACGVYARLRGKERPLSLRRNKIKPRTKHTR